jgi:hypothetical protein
MVACSVICLLNGLYSAKEFTILCRVTPEVFTAHYLFQNRCVPLERGMEWQSTRTSRLNPLLLKTVVCISTLIFLHPDPKWTHKDEVVGDRSACHRLLLISHFAYSSRIKTEARNVWLSPNYTELDPRRPHTSNARMTRMLIKIHII